METIGRSPRRGFIARVAAAFAALTAARAISPDPAEAQSTNDTAWIKDVPGKNRCFFDCPQHANGMGLLHILNYLGAYPAGQAGVVSSFYSVGPSSSIALGFNDAMWAKYELGRRWGVNGPQGAPATANPWKTGAPFSLEALGRRGAVFLACNRALRRISGEFAGPGGNATAVHQELVANLLPEARAVPAMVVALSRAQARGIPYMAVA